MRQYTPLEAVKTGMLPLMWLSLGISAGVSLFGISYMVPFAKELGFGPLIAASSAGVLSIINGTGRTLTGYLWTGSAASRRCSPCCWYRR